MTQTHFEFSSGPYLVYKIDILENAFLISQGLVKLQKQIAFRDVQYFQIAKQLGKVKFVIHHQESGKNKKLAISFDAYDSQSAEFVRCLKILFPKSTQWKNEFDQQEQLIHPLVLSLTAKFFGKHNPRWGILTIWIILFFPIGFYLLFTGGYRLTLSKQGLAVKKFLSKAAQWHEISKTSFSLLDITMRAYGANVGKERWMLYTIDLVDGKQLKFSMNALDGAQLLKVLIHQGKISQEFEKSIAI